MKWLLPILLSATPVLAFANPQIMCGQVRWGNSVLVTVQDLAGRTVGHVALRRNEGALDPTVYGDKIALKHCIEQQVNDKKDRDAMLKLIATLK